MHSDENVDKVEEITCVVKNEPSIGKNVLQFPKDSSSEDKGNVV